MRPARWKEQPRTQHEDQFTPLQAAAVRIGDKVNYRAIVLLLNEVNDLAELLAHSRAVFRAGRGIDELKRVCFEVNVPAHSVDRVTLLALPPVRPRSPQ
jgi:hypothetical protein